MHTNRSAINVFNVHPPLPPPPLNTLKFRAAYDILHPLVIVQVDTSNIILGGTESYGSDTTYYLTADASLVPTDATTPDSG